MNKFLRLIGLATRKSLDSAIHRAEKADEYARMVTAEAVGNGNIIVAGDCTSLEGLFIARGRSVIVPPWVSYTRIANCIFGVSANPIVVAPTASEKP